MSQAIPDNRPARIEGACSAFPLPEVSKQHGTAIATPVPSMHALAVNRHDELLGLLHDIDALSADELTTSDLPEQADRLLAEINATRKTPSAAAPTRRFQLIDRMDNAGRFHLQLEKACRRGDIPLPYPIDRDPLWLRAWVAKLSADDVAAVAKAFPQLRGALCVYLDASGINHLARCFHAGVSLDFEIDLREKKTWRLMPAHDAIHRGPPANFILLMKVALFSLPKDEAIPLAADALERFIAVRQSEEIANLIRHCKEFSWPDSIAIVPESKEFFVEVTRSNPVEHILCELIAPILAADPTYSPLLSLMADMNPSGLTWALRPMNFVPPEAMIDNAKTPEGREVLKRLRNPG